MSQLMRSDPEMALREALAESSRRVLPEEVLNVLEKPFSARGDLAVRAAVPRRGTKMSQPGLSRELSINGKVWQAYVYGRRLNDNTVYDTAVSGITLGKDAAVHADVVQVIDPNEIPVDAKVEPPVRLQSEHSVGEVQRVVRSGERYIPVCCAQHAQQVADTVRGIERGATPFLEAAGGNANTDTAPNFTASAHTQGAKSVLVIISDYSDKTGVPVDEDSGSAMNSSFLTNRLNTQVGPFINAVSYGATTIGSITVTPLIRVSGTLASYAKNNNPLGLKSAATTAATNAGYNPNNYDRVILVFADTLGISGNQWEWAGLADLGGKFIWNNGWFTLGTVAHEMLHTYGVRHANLWLPPAGSTNPVDLAGDSIEYGDSFDVMGEGPYNATTMPDHPNPWFLRRLGWLPASAVQSITTSGSYRLYRYDHTSASSANALSLYMDRDGTRQYWLGYRRKYLGHESHAAAGQGATLVWGYQNNTSSDLIDPSPLTDQLDSPIGVGSTFNDVAAGVSVQVTGQGGSAPNEYLDVQVTYQPRIVPHLTAVTVDEKAGSVALAVQRRSSSAGAVSVEYSTQTGTAGGSDFTATAGTLSWAAGDVSTKTITVPISADSSAEGTESFTVRLLNPSGCVLSHGNLITVKIADPGQQDSLYTHDELLGTVYDALVQPDGKAVVVGQFSAYGPVFSSGIVRLLEDGTVDPSFEQGEGANALPVACVTRQPDGKLLIGGKFTRIRGATRNYIARLNADGSLDTSFDAGTGPNVPGAAYSGINCITLQPDGKILVGGEFTTWSGSTRKCLVRLNSNGTLDSSFPNLSSLVEVFSSANGVRSIAICPSATAPHFSILVGGALRVTPANPGTKSGVIRLNPDGSKDASFDVVYGAHQSGSPNTAYPVTSLSVQPDGKILVGGQFTGFNNVTAKGLVRLNSNGTNDASFVTATGAGLTGTVAGVTEVTRIVVQPDGGIAVAGYFTAASGATGLKGLTRYLSTGARDTAFNATFSDAEGVNAAFLRPDNRLLIGLWDSVDGTKFVRSIATGIGTGKAGEIRFAAASSSTSEGSSASVVVERVGGSKGPISVNWHSLSGTALEGSDFPLQSGILTWADGDSASKTLQISTTADAGVESAETFRVALSNALGGALTGVNGVHTITLSDAPANQPLIGFTSSSSNAVEGAGVIQTTVALSGPAASGPVSANLAVSGSATLGADYSLGSSTVTITPPATTATVSITVADDMGVEGSEDLVLTLTSVTGGLVNSPQATHTVSIADNEIAASITDPLSAIKRVGESVSFSVTATGSPAPTMQWYKDGVPISGETSTALSIAAVSLNDAGEFQCVASVGSETYPSGIARLAVVDVSAASRALNIGGSTTFTVNATGTGVSYQWKKGTTTLTNGSKFTGVSTKTLSLKSLASGDAGTYTCTVSTAAGSALGGDNTLNLVTAAPIVSPPASLPPARVGAYYDPDGGGDGIAIPFNTTPSRSPATWSQTGLPAGMKINSATGVISGRPTVYKATPYSVVITATNSRGKHSMPTSILVSPLPAHAVGNFIGLLDKHDPLNSRFGGRIKFTVTSAGSYTGSLTMGPRGYTLTGNVISSQSSDIVTSTVNATLKGWPSLPVSFTIDGTTGKLTSGFISDGTHSMTFTGWKQLPASVAQQGYYTLHLSPPVSPYNAETIPQGIGFASFTIGAGGGASVVGRLPDTTSFTSAGHISETGQLVIYNNLYSLTGSLHGMVGVNNDGTLQTNSLTWLREPQASTAARSYRGGFSAVPLLINGGRYLMTLSGSVKAEFTPFDCDMPPPLPDVEAVLNSKGVLGKPITNYRKTTLTVNYATGAFSGTFTLVDPNPMNPLKYITRTPGTGFFYGMIVSDPLDGPTGLGHFTLPSLPSPAFPSSSTTLIYSGRVKVDNP
ncbi:MAG: immunoglobulin domain-containing protein [Verrucomicrobiaceae bacterium]|nr:immunoglobulin domain-containing protein [Verrucomicrobiaceae bacterium]